MMVDEALDLTTDAIMNLFPPECATREKIRAALVALVNVGYQIGYEDGLESGISEGFG